MEIDPLLTTQEVAEQLKIPVSTIYRWRYVGTGPDAIPVGRHLRFRQSAVDSWLVAQAEPSNKSIHGRR